MITGTTRFTPSLLETTKLLDAYTTYKIADYFKVTAGQFKVPFSLESLIADSQLEFIDRSQVVNALAGRATDVIGQPEWPGYRYPGKRQLRKAKRPLPVRLYIRYI